MQVTVIEPHATFIECHGMLLYNIPSRQFFSPGNLSISHSATFPLYNRGGGGLRLTVKVMVMFRVMVGVSVMVKVRVSKTLRLG